LGRVDEARAQIHKAYQEKDDLWEANFAMGLLAVHGGDFKAARDYMAKGKNRKGVLEGEDKYHYGLARVFLGEGNVEAAEQEALLAMTLNPSNTDYAQLTGDIYVQRGSPGLAIQAYERANSAPGATPTAPFFHQLGALFEKINEPNEALRRYQEAVKVDSTYAPALRDMGRLYARGRVPDKAFLAYSRYVQVVPDDLDALLALVRAGVEVRQFKSAHAAAKRAFAMDSTRTETRLLYARAAAQDKDPATAERLYASLPDSVTLEAVDHVRLGQIAFEAQRFDDAKKHLDQSVAMDSTSAEAYFILGLTELRRDQADPAIAALKKATEIAPTFTPAALNLGIAFLQAKRTDEGIAALRAAHAAAPENPQVLLSLAQALASADSTAAAVAEYRRVIEIDESNAKAYRGLGLCQLQRKSYGEAVTSLKQATSLESGNADGWAMLGQAYLGLNDVPRAKQAAERALSINAGHSTARSVLDVAKQARK
jgi:tetratricopeptide (TPR) repeat protein